MRIIGTGSALPKKIVTNEMLSEFLDTSDEWITTRTGITSRHVISDERLEDLGAEAAMKALDMAGLGVEDIDLFIVSNVVSEHITPGMSCVVAEKIGLNCPMFDINCACPGFIYALDMAEAYYKAGKAKNVLIACIYRVYAYGCQYYAMLNIYSLLDPPDETVEHIGRVGVRHLDVYRAVP